jgi:hypothetical protein
MGQAQVIKALAETFVLPVKASLSLEGTGALKVSIVAMEYIPGNTL